MASDDTGSGDTGSGDTGLDRAAAARAAELARIHVPAADLEPLARELAHILGWIEQLSAVDTDGVAPLAGVAGAAPAPPRTGPAVATGGAVQILGNAPAREGDFFVVPRVV